LEHMNTFTPMNCLKMVRRVALLGILVGLGMGISAQQPNGVELPSTAQKLPLIQVQKIKTVRFTDLKDDWNPVLKTVRTIHQPGLDARKDEILRLKQAANSARDSYLSSLGLESSEKISGTTPPTLGVNFFGNTYDFSDPADNSIGVSANGDVLSAHNTRVHIYNSSGTQQSASSLGGFVAGSGQPTNFTFDPKVSYDHDEDKYVVVFLNGASSTSSRIIVCFSETNDPTGNWNVYGINGNLNSLNVWTDFPQIGLNTNELFITGNLFNSSNASQGAAVWQINKLDGYSGAASLTIQSYYLPSNFSLHPVEGGASLYGPYMYFLESSTAGANSITLHRISNSIANNGILEAPLSFTMINSYSIAPDADQKGSNNNLSTNDCRVQSSYFQNNRIEFAMNTSAGGRSGVFHGTAQISPFLLSFSSFNGQVVPLDSDIFAAYPSVAYAGMMLDGTNKSYVAFNFCGPNDYPGTGVVYVDSSGYSPMLTIKTGVGPVNSAQNRWGDYADCQGRQNGAPGEAWVVGTFGNSSANQRTYIGQVFPPQAVSISQPQPESISMDVYPNPTTERVTFDFPVDEAGVYTVRVFDLQGKLIHTVIEDFLRVGEGRVSFTTTALLAGTYVVSVSNESAVLFQEKFNVVR